MPSEAIDLETIEGSYDNCEQCLDSLNPIIESGCCTGIDDTHIRQFVKVTISGVVNNSCSDAEAKFNGTHILEAQSGGATCTYRKALGSSPCGTFPTGGNQLRVLLEPGFNRIRVVGELGSAATFQLTVGNFVLNPANLTDCKNFTKNIPFSSQNGTGANWASSTCTVTTDIFS